MELPKNIFDADVQQAMQDLQRLMAQVLDPVNPLFPGFRLDTSNGIASLIEDGGRAYAGDKSNGYRPKLRDALWCFLSAKENLVRLLCSFFRGSPDYFRTLLDSIENEVGQLDADLKKGSMNSIEAVAVYARKTELNLDEAGKLYSAAKSKLQWARDEQQRINESRRRRALDAERQARSNQRAAEVDSMFASLLSGNGHNGNGHNGNGHNGNGHNGSKPRETLKVTIQERVR